jgi:hypothetical protein
MRNGPLPETNNKKRYQPMAKVRASDVGFCVVDGNANVIADNLVHRIREAAADMESQVNRLYRDAGLTISRPAQRTISRRPSSSSPTWRAPCAR